MTTTDPRPANAATPPMVPTPAGPDPQAAKAPLAPTPCPLPGPDSLSGQARSATHAGIAVEGSASPQVTAAPAPRLPTPAGNTATPPASSATAPRKTPLEGCETSQDQAKNGTHRCAVLADDIPGRQTDVAPHHGDAAGEQDPPAQATCPAAPNEAAPGLADPLLALAADILDDLEKVRIGNENRLRQLTRDVADTDGIERGFGLDATHPDVARLAALVQLLADAEHQATLNLQRSMRKHPLGPWVKTTKGIGEKQGARLIAAIGDPYWNTLHDRPRTVSELWAYCGYHVIFPASQAGNDTHSGPAGGELNGSGPGHGAPGAHMALAGVAPKRQRGQRANWSATAKMRAFLAAESCIKQRKSPYRAVYDTTRAKYDGAVHATECARCGPKGHPAKPGSALSDGHKHARALRAVAKAILRDLWREARRIRETPASSHDLTGTHTPIAAGG